LSLVVIGHFHETEAARATSFPIGDYLSPNYGAVAFEKCHKVVGSAFPRKVADINVLRHQRTFPGPGNLQNRIH
jgi:hypothetical protein